MKTRNLLLGTMVLILAVGTAFASRALSGNIYTKVYMTSQAELTHTETCLNTQVTCADVSGSRCRVRLQVQKAGAPNVTSITFKDDACTVPITQVGDDIAQSLQEPWALVNPE